MLHKPLNQKRVVPLTAGSWRCDPNRCSLRAKITRSALADCQELAAAIGAFRSFSYDGGRLDARELTACNESAPQVQSEPTIEAKATLWFERQGVVVTGGGRWKCTGFQCTGQIAKTASASACQQLAAEVRHIKAFTLAFVAHTASQLTTCNASVPQAVPFEIKLFGEPQDKPNATPMIAYDALLFGVDERDERDEPEKKVGIWKCRGARCKTDARWPKPTVEDCHELYVRLGRRSIKAFGNQHQRLTPTEVGQCHSAKGIGGTLEVTTNLVVLVPLAPNDPDTPVFPNSSFEEPSLAAWAFSNGQPLGAAMRKCASAAQPSFWQRGNCWLFVPSGQVVRSQTFSPPKKGYLKAMTRTMSAGGARVELRAADSGVLLLSENAAPEKAVRPIAFDLASLPKSLQGQPLRLWLIAEQGAGDLEVDAFVIGAKPPVWEPVPRIP